MEFEIIVENENILFKRKEIEGIIKSNICPSKEEVSTFLSEKYSIPKENIKIETIMGKFGAQEFVVVAQLYNSKEDKDSTEIKTKKQRDAEKKAIEEEAKLKAEQEAAKKEAENNPVEEKQEENVVEEKKEELVQENKEEAKVE